MAGCAALCFSFFSVESELQINSSYVHNDTSQWMAFMKLSINSNSDDTKTIYNLSITKSFMLRLIFLDKDSFLISLCKKLWGEEVPSTGWNKYNGTLEALPRLQQNPMFQLFRKCCIAYPAYKAKILTIPWISHRHLHMQFLQCSQNINNFYWSISFRHFKHKYFKSYWFLRIHIVQTKWPSIYRSRHLLELKAVITEMITISVITTFSSKICLLLYKYLHLKKLIIRGWALAEITCERWPICA